MGSVTSVTAELMKRGELWQPAPGLTALRGDAARLHAAIAREIRALCTADASEEWHVPPGLPFDALDRADYFASFPQWLTATSHLGGGEDGLADVAGAIDGAAAALAALTPAPVALQPAVCYHVYAALEGRVLDEPHDCAVCGTCWRHETGRFVPLERDWSFTMQELVRAGTPAAVHEFRVHGIDAAQQLASRLGLRPRIAQATDPFFAPDARGRALLQQIRSLKHELLLPVDYGRTIAAASFNDHGSFFGTAFDIRLEDGSAATTGCIAFGIERWVLAVLCEHGTDADNWPIELRSARGEAVPAGHGGFR